MISYPLCKIWTKRTIYRLNIELQAILCFSIFNNFWKVKDKILVFNFQMNFNDEFVLIGIDELFFVNCWFCIYANAELLYFKWEANIFIYLLLSEILHNVYYYYYNNINQSASCIPRWARWTDIVLTSLAVSIYNFNFNLLQASLG